MRACVHSVGMLCGYMPNSSFGLVLVSSGLGQVGLGLVTLVLVLRILPCLHH